MIIIIQCINIFLNCSFLKTKNWLYANVKTPTTHLPSQIEHRQGYHRRLSSRIRPRPCRRRGWQRVLVRRFHPRRRLRHPRRCVATPPFHSSLLRSPPGLPSPLPQLQHDCMTCNQNEIILTTFRKSNNRHSINYCFFSIILFLSATRTIATRKIKLLREEQESREKIQLMGNIDFVDPFKQQR